MSLQEWVKWERVCRFSVFPRRLLPQTWHIWVFTPGGHWLLLKWILFFFYFKVKPLNLWIYFQNFYNFACMLMNAREWPSTIFFTSFACLTCLKSIFSSKFGFVNFLYNKKTIWRKVPFKTILISETGKQSSRGPLPGIH